MGDRVAESRIRASIRDALASFFHWSLVFVAMFAAGFTYLVHAMQDGRDLATPVFAISGTLVGLILPAASLTAQYIEPRLNFLAEERVKRELDLIKIKERGLRDIEAMESVVEPLWRGFVFVFVSFPLSILALMRPDLHVWSVSAEEMLVGTSLGLVVVAAFSFLPFTWEVLQLDLARATRSKLFAPSASSQPGPAATTSQGEVGRKGKPTDR